MELHAIQRAFCDTIVDDESVLPSYFDNIAPERLHIYRNAYRARTLECLATVFEKTKAWVGDESFTMAAQDHIVRNPPYSRSLDDYGVGFDETLERLFLDDPEVAELGWIEWTMHRIFCAADEKTIGMSSLPPELADPDAWDDALIRFAANITARRVKTNVAAIWQAIHSGRASPDVAMLPDAAYVCIWRQEFVPMFRTLSATEYAAMVAIRKGANFGEICSAIMDGTSNSEGAAKAGELLSRWLGDGMLTGIDVESGLA